VKEFFEAYVTVAHFLTPIFAGIGIGICLWVLSMSLRFTYLYFVQTGKMVLWGAENRNIEEVWVRKLDRRGLPFGWGLALTISGFVILATWVSIWIWPITVLVTLPMLCIVLLGWRARKKTAFLQKLKGEE
jgi:hypothetical protein